MKTYNNTMFSRGLERKRQNRRPLDEVAMRISISPRELSLLTRNGMKVFVPAPATVLTVLCAPDHYT